MRLRIALGATAFVALIEVVGGIAAGSLALFSDAAHVAMDVVALAIALAAQLQVARPANERHTYGFARFEILASLANSALLTGVTLFIVAEAVRRFAHPETPAGSLMAIVAAIGVVVNVAAGWMLMRDDHAHNLNLRAVLLHVGGDALGGIAVVVGGVAIARTGATWIDPALSLVVAAIIVVGVLNVVRDATAILLESAPAHASVPAVRGVLRACDGVVDVHDLHVWTIGTGAHVLSAHVVLDDRRISEATDVLRRITALLREQFAITHVTVQFECESCGADERIVCTQDPRSREPLSAS